MASSASRLHKAGLSRFAGVAVVVSASVLPMTANAAIIYSGPVNQSIPISGGFIQVNISGTSSGFQLSSGSKGSPYLNLITMSDEALVNDTSANQLINVGNNYSIGPVSSSPPYYNVSPHITASDFPSAGGYFGFEFAQNSTTYYGYGQLAVSTDGSTLTFVDYAYDNTGAAILTPAATSVPEPASLSVMLLGVGAVGTVLRRGGRNGRTAA